MKSFRKLKTIAPVLLFLMGVTFSGCDTFNPIDIGFVGQLTGKFSDIGVAGRNGARLAIEDANAQGGINGRTIHFLPRDDGNTPATAVQAVEELTDEGCTAIIGPMTSAMSTAVAPRARVVLMSPTTSTSHLSNKDDLFFRVMPVNTRRAIDLANYAQGKRSISNVFVVGDQDNADYVNTFNNAFVGHFSANGGTISGRLDYSSNELRDWGALLAPIAEAAPEALLLSASARDVGALARRMKRMGLDIPILCPSWPYTTEVIQAGGTAVEGIIFSTSYVAGSKRPQFLAFKKRFTARYGYPPGFPEVFAYEAAMALVTALRQDDGDTAAIKEALLGIDEYEGLLGPFHFNQYGDVKRKSFITTIRNGQFVLAGED